MRLLHVTSGSDAGGVSRYLCDLCVSLAQGGHDVTVAGQRGVWHDLFVDAGVQWIEAPTNGSFLDLRHAARQLAGEQPYDLVHAHYRKSAIVARRIAHAHHAPMLFTLHLTGIPHGFLHRLMSDFGDVAHAPSAAAARWLTDVARVPSPRVVVIPHGVDPRKFPVADEATRRAAREALGLPHDVTVAAYVGRFDEPKNEQWVVDVARAQPQVRVVMMGDGPRVSALADAPVVMLPYGDPLPVYHAADLLLLPSSLEGFSLVTAEASCAGCAVLRTDTAGAAETVVHGQTGEVCAIDREAFVAAAGRMLQDRAALRAMGDAAAAHVRAKLSYDQQVQMMIELYETMLGGKH